MKNLILALSLAIAACGGCTKDTTSEATQALAGASCMADAYGGALNCTANDVGIASASNIRGLDGQPLASCIEGTTFSFIADFNVKLTAQARYDVGLYFATDGDPNADGALTGTCGVNTITPANSPNFVQLDAAPDTCGDIDGAHNPQTVTVQVDNVLCKAGAGGLLSLPNCTSWRQSGSNEVCDEAADAFPGSPSKCNCDVGFTVPIAVAPPEAAIVKSHVSLLCSEHRYQVSITNGSLTSPLSLTSLVDSSYGDLLSVHDQVLATTCAPGVLGVGASQTCTFDARFCGPSDTDTATAALVDDHGVTISRTSNTVVVDVSATAR